MTALRVVRASFVRCGEELVAPFSLDLQCAERVERVASNEREAALIARIAAAVVKPTSGAVYVGDFDARLQAAQAKRCVAFVPAGTPAPPDFARALDFYAAAFRVEHDVARDRAAEVLAALGDGPYARNAALALSHAALLIVLDRPPAGIAEALATLQPGAALFVSHAPPALVTAAPAAKRALEVLR